jgi:hypothetical protein
LVWRGWELLFNQNIREVNLYWRLFDLVNLECYDRNYLFVGILYIGCCYEWKISYIIEFGHDDFSINYTLINLNIILINIMIKK